VGFLWCLRYFWPGALDDAPGVPGFRVSCPGAELDAPCAKAASVTARSAISTVADLRSLVIFDPPCCSRCSNSMRQAAFPHACGREDKLATDPDGRMATVRRQRPKLINDLSVEARKLIEDVTVDRNGNVIPKLYSKLQANKELRQMHNIGRTDDRPETDVSRLSDAELIQQLSDQAKELGIKIDLNYTFAQLPPATEADSSPPVVDVTPDAGVTTADAADVAVAAELKIAAQPGVAGARPVRAARPKHR
jgi:hypothetical protein